MDSDLNRKERELLVSFGLKQVSGNHAYYYEIVGAGLFFIDQLPDENIIKQLSTINCPAILFPYIRETIADLTRRAGFKPLHHDPINFIEYAKLREQKYKAKKSISPKKAKTTAKKKKIASSAKKKVGRKKKSKAK